ncbi:MAG: DUF2461 domain-containing protein [Bacteroidaceae bacterium]|nr:DUF2461 domain-containing protein [Bacteroidaceae bacterium]
MQDIIQFLQNLQANNSREWFADHKAEYQAAQARFNAFAESLQQQIVRFDPSVAGLTAKDMTYRIYRDTRFSKDKTPYKTHMGLFIARGGKKSGYAGYYMQVGVENQPANFGDFHWETQHIIAPGHYCVEPKALQVIREDIVHGEGDFDRLVREVAHPDFRLVTSGSLKRNPKGFAADAPWSEYLRLKFFCLGMSADTDFLTAPRLAERVAERFETARPFLDYINRAIDYVREEG